MFNRHDRYTFLFTSHFTQLFAGEPFNYRDKIDTVWSCHGRFEPAGSLLKIP